MINMVDLHTHSNMSDGRYSPAELIILGKKQGLSVLALTDHDTIIGINEAGKAAKQAGIGFIAGIELEINRELAQGEFHLLGLGIDKPGQAFIEAVADLSRRREERNLEILNRMEKLDIKADYKEILAMSGGYSVGRPHFASFLVKHRIVKNMEQAFIRYLGKGKPLYVPKAGLDFDHALRIIKEAGGLAILAHPMSLYASWSRLPSLIKSLKDRGLQGLEAWHPSARVSYCKRLECLAKSLELYVTAGSDFHGENRRNRKLGITAGGRKIERSMLDAIPELAEKVYS